MKKVCIAISSVFLISCSSIKQETRYKQAYIEDFKMIYFKKCLEKGFNNNEITYLNIIDKSTMTEPILGAESYLVIDSLTNLYNENIKSGEVAEGLNDKQVYSTCLCHYQSKWLKAYAIKMYKLQKR